MALVLPLHEKLGKDKHVESLWFPRLDEGSIPSRSTGDNKSHFNIILEVAFIVFVGGVNVVASFLFIFAILLNISKAKFVSL